MRLADTSALDTIVVRVGKRIEVTFVEGDKTSCSAEVVDYIVMATGETVETIATIIARIQSLGDMNGYSQKQQSKSRFPNKVIMEKLPCIIEAYGVEATLQIMEQIRHCDLKAVFNSINPVEAIQEVL